MRVPIQLAIALLAGAPAPATPAAPDTVLVLDLTAGPEIRPELLRALSDQLAVQVRKLNPRARVLGFNDVRSMMALETQRSRLNCQQASCLAEIGGALGAREVVNGWLARVGSREVLTLKRVLSRDVKVIADTTASVALGEEEKLLAAVKAGAERLYPALEVPPDGLLGEAEGGPPPADHSHVAALLLGSGALVAAGVAVAGLVLYQGGSLDGLRTQSPPPSASDIVGHHNQAVLGTALGFSGLAVAVGLATGAVLAW